MKFPISWHKECLENMRASAAHYRKAANRAIADAEQCEKACIAYDAQIIRAEEMGVAEFDRDKFGIKRPRATPRPA